MSGFCEWVIADEYCDGPMSGIGLRFQDQKTVLFKVVGWDSEQWQRVFAVAPVPEKLIDQLCSMLEKLEPRRRPFWLPGPATNQPEINAVWQAALTDALHDGAWILVESHDLLESSAVKTLSSEQRAVVSTLVEKKVVKDLAGASILQSFVDEMGNGS
jgi:hypothetical protein